MTSVGGVSTTDRNLKGVIFKNCWNLSKLSTLKAIKYVSSAVVCSRDQPTPSSRYNKQL